MCGCSESDQCDIWRLMKVNLREVQCDEMLLVSFPARRYIGPVGHFSNIVDPQPLTNRDSVVVLTRFRAPESRLPAGSVGTILRSSAPAVTTSREKGPLHVDMGTFPP